MEEITLVPRKIATLVLFLFIGVPIFFLFAIIGNFLLNFSGDQETIIGTWAIPSGIISDYILRRFLKIKLLFLEKPQIPFIYFYLVFCVLLILGMSVEDIFNLANKF